MFLAALLPAALEAEEQQGCPEDGGWGSWLVLGSSVAVVVVSKSLIFITFIDQESTGTPCEDGEEACGQLRSRRDAGNIKQGVDFTSFRHEGCGYGSSSGCPRSLGDGGTTRFR